MIRVDLKGRIGSLDLSIAFEAPSPGLTAIMGPSGAGKTTLLRAIAGLERLSGHVEIKGTVWQDGGHHMSVPQRSVGYIPQEPALFTHLSVSGNLDFAAKRPLRICGFPSSTVQVPFNGCRSEKD